MSIFKELFSDLEKKISNASNDKFNKLSEEKKQTIIDKALALKGNELDRFIEKQPSLLSYIISELPSNEDVHIVKLLNVATKAGVSVYDLIDKNEHISNSLIVNTAVKNQPELVLELDDMPSLQDLITPESVVEAFVKNPEVLFSECKALNSKVSLNVVAKDGTQKTVTSKLKTQLKRAINLYFRPKAYKKNGYDEFAKEVADKIKGDEFANKIANNKVTTRMATAANEVLKKSPEKGKIMPAKSFKNWNNRVLYVVPGVVKKMMKNKKEEYEKYYSYLLGLLKNPSLSTFTEKERTKLAKRCVSIIPEIYFELSKIAAFKVPAQALTVQLSAYEAFVKAGDRGQKAYLIMCIACDYSKKRVDEILKRAKSNETRRANKIKIAKQEKEMEQTL